MKKRMLAVVASAMAFVCGAATADNPVLRIMPLGDSITYGSCSESGGGYRAPLLTLLTQAGYNVDYVGTQTTNPRKDGSLADVDHEGHSGWRLSSASSGIYENILPWFSQIRDPHVILLHLGTNDTGDGETTFCSQGIPRLVNLLDRIHAAQPSAKVIVTTLLRRIGSDPNDQKNTWIQRDFNPHVADVVAAQVAKGQQAYFLDMCAAVSDDGLHTDGLHPKDAGYVMMANAWFEKIQEIIPDPTQCGGVNTPTLLTSSQAVVSGSPTCTIAFNQPMNATQLADASTWTLTGTTAPWSVAAAPGARTATFTFDRADFGKNVTIAAANLETADDAAVKWTGSKSFPIARALGIENNVSASTRAGYELVYDVAIPSKGAAYRYNNVDYKTDRHLLVPAFSRVAYYLELQKEGEDLQYVWVSMDAFTTDPGKIGVPTARSGAVFQQDVNNLFIESNVAGIRTGENIANGNIEFWPNTYNPVNKRGLAGANTNLYDHDDTFEVGDTHYGSMQVHDTALGGDGCIFAWNRWSSATDSTDVGIGKCTTKDTATDWTQTYNSGSYKVRNLQVYVLPAPATEAPTLVSATRDAAQRRITATFSMPVAEGNLASSFALAGGRITGVKRDPANASVVLIDFLPTGGDVSLTVSGVCEASSALIAMAAPVTVPVTFGGLPAEITSAVNDPSLTDGYDVLYALDIPATHVNWLTAEKSNTSFKYSEVPYSVNRENDYPLNADRVAYFMELRNGSGVKWVWVSMDAFSPSLKKFGVPVSEDRAIKQTYVTNMDVKSNVSGITNGRNMDGGFIEFWCKNYNNANAFNVPGADTNTYDFGDRMDATGNYACMQVHDYKNKQVLFAFNNFGANNGSSSCIGIGNDTVKGSNGGVNPDYTFHYTAGDYTSRKLWVLVRPGPAKTLNLPPPAEVAKNVPEATGFNHLYTLTLPASGMKARNPTNYPTYHTVDNRAQFAGTRPSRVAYYLELVKNDGTTNWCWTAFNAFTDDMERYSLPTNYAKLVQQRIANLDVRSNVAGVSQVTGSAKGNIEFFPCNYNRAAKLGLPGGSGDKFDFDDTPQSDGSYGCMQVHNWGNKETCWAVGHFNEGDLQIGIGNNTTNSEGTDWTYVGTGNNYTSRKLHVFLKFDEEAPNLAATPTVRRVITSLDRTQLCVEFASEPSEEFDSAIYEIATVRTGAVVKRVERSVLDPREYILTLSAPLAANTSYTLKGNVTRYSGEVSFSAAFTTPKTARTAVNLTEANVPEFGGYRLVNEIEFGSGGVSVTANGANYSVDESRFGVVPFDRIAYFLELVGTNGVTQWVWASMDAFTTDAAKIGLPSVQRENFFQQYVNNLKVCSGATGEGATAAAVAGEFAKGNIEFFTSNYDEANTLGIPGASGSTFDFGDNPTYAHGRNAGHGCLQIHDYLNARTVLSINCLNGTPALGIGNDTVATSYGINPDWTHHSNAGSFTARRFYVYVRPAAAPEEGAENAFTTEPADGTFEVGANTQFKASAPGAVSYAWLLDGKVVPGATGPVFNAPALTAGTHTVQAVATFADGTIAAGRTATITAAWPENFTSPHIRIMPLGDSITYGVVGGGGSYQGGYRKKLWNKLTAANYDIEFIGSQTGNSDGMTSNNHEGHSGWKISHESQGLFENIIGWFKGTLNPHVVLVHIGTNDTGDSGTFPAAIDRLDALVDRIADAQPGAIIIVSSLLERGASQYALITKHFNPYLRERVRGHQLKGQKVRYLDMNAYVPLSDMPDQLHPNEAGYDKMAQGWYDAITEIWPTAANVELDDSIGILSYSVNNAGNVCTVSFNQPVVAADATDVSNWDVSGFTPASVTLSSDGRTATVTMAQPLAAGREHTISFLGAERSFYVSIPRGIANNVPASERKGYEKVYEIDIPSTKANYNSVAPKYSVDNHRTVRPFSRVAYYFELRRPNENLQYAWVAMDAFTDDAGKIGIPTKASGAVFQQKVNNMRVVSNVEGVRSGEIGEGNIEMWPYSYTTPASLNLPGANSTYYDFDDLLGTGNYGSFQVHDFQNETTIFAYNDFMFGDKAQDLGIGNCPYVGIKKTEAGVAGSDWTFMRNSAEYEVRHLEVWALPDVDHATPPNPVRAVRAASGRQIVVDFDENLAAKQDFVSAFALSDGTPVASVVMLAGNKLRLEFATAVASENLQLTVSGLRDDSIRAAAMPQPVTIDVDCAAAMPADVVARVGAAATTGFKLVYDLAVPEKTDWIARGDDMYDVNDARYFDGGFDRIAYLFELVTVSCTTQYVWVAMDPFTRDVRKTGIPIPAKKCYFQQNVANMDVYSNVSGVKTGTGYQQGNVEMWPHDYSGANAINIPNASNSAYDFGDTRSTGGSYGSFQVHNAGEKQVLFAINNWGTDGKVPCVGIGSQTANASNLDWTFAENARNYVSRRLRVFVRPAENSVEYSAPDAIVDDVPDAANFEHLYTVDLPAKPKFSDAASNTACHVVNNASAIAAKYDTTPARVAYYMELIDNNDNRTWVWTAFDGVTNNFESLSVPRGNARLWQKVNNLDVKSNVAGVTQGEGIATGNIEFNAHNYSNTTKLGLGGSSSAYDFDDSPSDTGSYGCMQVHNWGEKQTIWAFNNFNAMSDGGGVACIGIGTNNHDANKDWTFTYNATNYKSRKLYVFVRWNVADAITGKTAVPRRAIASADGTQLCVSFDNAVPNGWADLAYFSCAGVQLAAATVSPAEPRDVIITLGAPLAAGASHTLVFTDPEKGTTKDLAFKTLSGEMPQVIADVDDSEGYELVNKLEIGTAVAYSHNGANYVLDESRFKAGMIFDRIAYCLELVGTNGVKTWAWTSMDAFTSDVTKIGVPSVERNVRFQQYVHNLHVRAGTSSGTLNLTTGDYARGNIEFWPNDYNEANSANIAGASATAFDWGDKPSQDYSNVGYGSMQVHVTDKGQTAWAFNAFGSSGGVNNTADPGIGVGNCDKTKVVGAANNSGTDWTHVHNSKTYTVRNLYVLVRPVELSDPGSAAFRLQPQSECKLVGSGVVNLAAFADGAIGYQWFCDGVPVLGATETWLDVPANRCGAHSYCVNATFADGTHALSDVAVVDVYSRGTVLLFR